MVIYAICFQMVRSVMTDCSYSNLFDCFLNFTAMYRLSLDDLDLSLVDGWT